MVSTVDNYEPLQYILTVPAVIDFRRLLFQLKRKYCFSFVTSVPNDCMMNTGVKKGRCISDMTLEDFRVQLHDQVSSTACALTYVITPLIEIM
jgi:hypothetical protein